MRYLIPLIISIVVPVWGWAQECPDLPVHQRVRLAAVHDGDTLRLADGRRVRLLAVNSPELPTDDTPGQPLAGAARKAVEAFFAGTDYVQLSFESRRTDRYGRTLAHVLHPSGRNLETHLVRRGLAVPLAVPPDLAMAGCLRALAQQARREQRGMWATDYWQPLPVDELKWAKPGFRMVCGRVNKVDRQNGLWIELAGPLVIRIARDDFPHFQTGDFDLGDAERWPGRTLRVSGWIRDRSRNRRLMERGFKPWLVQVRTPFALEWLRSSGTPCR